VVSLLLVVICFFKFRFLKFYRSIHRFLESAYYTHGTSEFARMDISQCQIVSLRIIPYHSASKSLILQWEGPVIFKRQISQPKNCR